MQWNDEDPPKLELDSVDDFLQLVDNVMNASDRIMDDELKKTGVSSRVQQLVRERMEKFVQAASTMVAHNILLDGEDGASLVKFDCEPFNKDLREEAIELEKKARKMTRNVINQRRTIVDQISVLLKDIVQRESLPVENATFSDDEETEDRDEPRPLDTSTMSKEYHDAVQILANLEKTVPQTLADYEELEEILDTREEIPPGIEQIENTLAGVSEEMTPETVADQERLDAAQER